MAREVTIGDRICGPGTHITLEEGAVFGPIIAGPEGVTCWELSFGEFGGWGDEPELYERAIAARGVTPLPDPPLHLADWFVDPRGDTGAVRPTPRVPGLDEVITQIRAQIGHHGIDRAGFIHRRGCYSATYCQSQNQNQPKSHSHPFLLLVR